MVPKAKTKNPKQESLSQTVLHQHVNFNYSSPALNYCFSVFQHPLSFQIYTLVDLHFLSDIINLGFIKVYSTNKEVSEFEITASHYSKFGFEEESETDCLYLNYKAKIGFRFSGVSYKTGETNHGRKLYNDLTAFVQVFFAEGKSDKDLLNKVLNLIKNYTLKRLKSKARIKFLCANQDGFYFSEKFFEEVSVDLALNYGEDFLSKDKKLKEFLNSHKTGLIILHSLPGQGKTTYIKYLLGIIKNVVYVPAHLIENMANPEFLSFMLTQENVILVIEDAERIITNREESGNTSAVSNLLNLTDGILGTAINIKIICTFNTGLSNIDPALLRKGRLAFIHEFHPLKAENANILLTKLGKKFTTDKPMSLAEIYNQEDENFFKPKEKEVFGFGQR